MFEGSYNVYRDVLESRQIGRTFKLVYPKQKCQFVMTLSVLTCYSAGPKHVTSVSVYF